MSTLMQQRYPNSYRTFEACAAWHGDPYLYLDADEELVGCNDALLELTGFESFEKLQAKRATLPQLFVPETGRELPDVGVWYERSNAVPLYGRIKDKGGEIRLYRVRIKEVTLDVQPLYLVTLEEKTEQERATAARRRYEELTGNLLVNISKEFRTPLNSIVGFTGLLEHTSLDVVQHEYLTHIRDASEAITSTVDNLIELMQAERGDFRVAQELFDPMALFEPIGSRYLELARVKGISLLFMFDPKLPKQLLGDAKKIVRVMRNLVDNAIKFTEPGGQVYVEVACREVDIERAMIEYSVADTGAGIAEEALATIARPFTSAYSETSREGLGIGLHVSHRLLGAMQSRLRVASRPGRGSRFSFRLAHRIGEASRFAPCSVRRAAVMATRDAMALQGKLLQQYLEAFGIESREVTGVDDGWLDEAELLFLLNANVRPETVAAIKGRHRALKVAAVVTSAREEELRGETLGSDWLVALPLLPEKLHATLSQPAAPELLAPETQSREVISRQAAILIAEDNPINQKLMTTLLEKFHYEIAVADNGQEAVDAYLERPYDLVLMDIDMPVMDGLTATRLIHEIDRREKRRRVPIIALTAHALPGDRERILDAGLDEYLTKPVDTAILLRMIRLFLQETRSNIRPPSA